MNIRHRSGALELIDGPIESREELEQSFRDIALANRWFGGTDAARRALRKLRPKTVLDVGCGIGDIPLALSIEARRDRSDLTFTCLDISDDLLAVARTRSNGDPRMSFVRGNGTALPFPDASFDVAMCNLALHHFSEDDAVALLRELRRVSKNSPVVTDLRRSRATWLAALAFSRTFTSNRLTRHDGPLSALRAYTPEEALSLAVRAGWKAPQVQRFSLIRMVLLDAATI